MFYFSCIEVGGCLHRYLSAQLKTLASFKENDKVCVKVKENNSLKGKLKQTQKRIGSNFTCCISEAQLLGMCFRHLSFSWRSPRGVVDI